MAGVVDPQGRGNGAPCATALPDWETGQGSITEVLQARTRRRPFLGKGWGLNGQRL